MRRILFPLLIIGLAAGLFSLGSGAFFSDTETSTGNTFTAGSLNLTLDDAGPDATDGETATWVFADMKPDDSGFATLHVNNTGSLPGSVDLSGIAKTNLENVCLEPELPGDTSCTAADGDGELGANLTVTLCWDAGAGDGDCLDGGDTVIYGPGTLNGLAAAYDLDTVLGAGATLHLTLAWHIDSGVGNIIQSDSSGLSFTVELDQTAD